MTIAGMPGDNAIDRRGVVYAVVSKMGLSEAAGQYVRRIAGGHYTARNDTLTVSVNQHADGALNRRLALEQVVDLVVTAQALAKEHGPFVKKRVMPRYQY